MSTHYLNWDQPSMHVAIDDGPSVKIPPGLASYIENLSAGDLLVLEPTFESYNWAEHNRCIDLAEEHGVIMRTVSHREVGRRLRREQGSITRHGDITARSITNRRSAEIMRDLHLEGRHLARPLHWPLDEQTDRDIFEAKRRGGFIKSTDLWTQEHLAWLPDYTSLPRRLQDALGAPDLAAKKLPLTSSSRLKGYSLNLVCYLAMTADESADREDFDHRIGFHEHGHACFDRALLYNRTITITARHLGIDAKTFQKNDRWPLQGYEAKVHKASMKRMRRAARQIYSWRRAGSSPGTGSQLSGAVLVGGQEDVL